MDCFGSVNLRNKNHCFFNEQLSKEEYEAKVKGYNLHTREGVERARKDADIFWKKFPNKSHQGIKNIDSTGSYVSNSKNVKDSFLVREGENLRYCQYLQEMPAPKDCYDYSIWGSSAEMVYEVAIGGSGIQNLKFCFLSQENVHDLEYCVVCTNGSENLFGCVGLRKKDYCILNKQYTKEEYEALVPKIIEHMKEMPYVDKAGHVYKYGEFYPIEMSPWAYNETIAQEYFPLTKEQALAKGYRWREPDTKDYTPTLRVEDVPSDITTVDDSITKEIIECAHKGECNQGCTKAFRIIPDELQFYRKIGVPLPILCPACRTMERLKLRLKMELYDEACMCAGTNSKDGVYKNHGMHNHGNMPCQNIFKTGYKPGQGDMIYCEQCYQQEVQ
jgi:hypothetical protein